MKAAKILSVVLAVTMMAGITACNDNSGKNKKNEPRGHKTEDEDDETEATKEDKDSDEVPVETSQDNDDEYISFDQDVKSNIYEDDILSFELPPEATYEEYDSIIWCYLMPDDGYTELLKQYDLADNVDTKVKFIQFDTNAQEGLEWFFDADVENASEAADLAYQDYIDTGYIESSSQDLGCVGRMTMEIDGQTAYVVWHRGAAENLIGNCGPNYQCYVDSPKGTIVEIIYADYGDSLTTRYVDVLASVEFKYLER